MTLPIKRNPDTRRCCCKTGETKPFASAKYGAFRPRATMKGALKAALKATNPEKMEVPQQIQPEVFMKMHKFLSLRGSRLLQLGHDCQLHNEGPFYEEEKAENRQPETKRGCPGAKGLLDPFKAAAQARRILSVRDFRRNRFSASCRELLRHQHMKRATQGSKSSQFLARRLNQRCCSSIALPRPSVIWCAKTQWTTRVASWL
eukprot:TRINITY_DN5493_c0_g1_i1.p1 TRINITY_DN5493_c0_g1~~TRINITY_DN5493_c0_g1_i1.p1  ORF type:complete len:203 (-),score=23.24 TRINITY_DN5493_c0_g1_i1:957-1565(-)